MPKFYLGVDGGGTYTRVAIIDLAGKIISQNQNIGSNANVYGYNQAIINLSETIKQAMHDLKGEVVACLAISGVNFAKDQSLWKKTIDGNAYLKSLFTKPPLIVNDSQAALRSGTTEKNALVIIAGTGSNCYGVNSQGNEAKSAGVDYILSDEGGGYWIGLEILSSITKSLDGRGEKTILTDMVFDKFKIKTLEELYNLVYETPWNKTQIAKIASLAEEAANSKDSVAERITDKAAEELSLMIKAVATKLKLISTNFTIVKAGSILNIERLICKKMQEKTVQFAPKATFVDQNIDSAHAAAFLALEKFE